MKSAFALKLLLCSKKKDWLGFTLGSNRGVISAFGRSYFGSDSCKAANHTDIPRALCLPLQYCFPSAIDLQKHDALAFPEKKKRHQTSSMWIIMRERLMSQKEMHCNKPLLNCWLAGEEISIKTLNPNKNTSQILRKRGWLFCRRKMAPFISLLKYMNIYGSNIFFSSCVILCIVISVSHYLCQLLWQLQVKSEMASTTQEDQLFCLQNKSICE